MLDEDRRMVVHPAKPELVGQQMGNNPAESHWQHMVDLGKGGHQGRLEYPVGLPCPARAAQKMSLVTGHQPWGWILGSGVLLQDIEATIWWSQYEWMGGATLLVILLMGLLGPPSAAPSSIPWPRSTRPWPGSQLAICGQHPGAGQG